MTEENFFKLINVDLRPIGEIIDVKNIKEEAPSTVFLCCSYIFSVAVALEFSQEEMKAYVDCKKDLTTFSYTLTALTYIASFLDDMSEGKKPKEAFKELSDMGVEFKDDFVGANIEALCELLENGRHKDSDCSKMSDEEKEAYIFLCCMLEDFFTSVILIAKARIKEESIEKA